MKLTVKTSPKQILPKEPLTNEVSPKEVLPEVNITEEKLIEEKFLGEEYPVCILPNTSEILKKKSIVHMKRDIVRLQNAIKSTKSIVRIKTTKKRVVSTQSGRWRKRMKQDHQPSDTDDVNVTSKDFDELNGMFGLI